MLALAKLLQNRSYGSSVDEIWVDIHTLCYEKIKFKIMKKIQICKLV